MSIFNFKLKFVDHLGCWTPRPKEGYDDAGDDTKHSGEVAVVYLTIRASTTTNTQVI